VQCYYSSLLLLKFTEEYILTYENIYSHSHITIPALFPLTTVLVFYVTDYVITCFGVPLVCGIIRLVHKMKHGSTECQFYCLTENGVFVILEAHSTITLARLKTFM
jgi:hypothetical protein